MAQDHLIESYNVVTKIEKLQNRFADPNIKLRYISYQFEKLEDGVRYYLKANGEIISYSFEDYFALYFNKTLLSEDLNRVINSYGITSQQGGDFKGYIQFIMRRLEYLKKHIEDSLDNSLLKTALLRECDDFKPQLIRNGVNSKNLEIQEQAVELIKKVPEIKVVVNDNNGILMRQIFPINVGQKHNEISFKQWIKLLHTELTINRKFIDNCSLEEFKNIFTLKKEEQKNAKTPNWLNSNVRFALLIQQLFEGKYIGRPFWKQAASCFTILGQINTADNLKSYPAKATNNDKKVIAAILNNIAKNVGNIAMPQK